jgi:hypothetical protein
MQERPAEERLHPAGRKRKKFEKNDAGGKVLWVVYFFANSERITFNAPPALNHSICGSL